MMMPCLSHFIILTRDIQCVSLLRMRQPVIRCTMYRNVTKFRTLEITAVVSRK